MTTTTDDASAADDGDYPKFLPPRSTEPGPDIPRLRAVLARIIQREAEAGHWDQGAWGEMPLSSDSLEYLRGFAATPSERGDGFELPSDPEQEIVERCGTALCFAGWTVVMDRAETRWEMDRISADLIGARQSGSDADAWEHPSDYARKALGLTPSQEDALFSPANGQYALAAMIDALEREPDISGGDLYHFREASSEARWRQDRRLAGRTEIAAVESAE